MDITQLSFFILIVAVNLFGLIAMAINVYVYNAFHDKATYPVNN